MMWGMQLEQPGRPLVRCERPDPLPGPGQVRIRVSACGVCRTDLHIVDGELAPLRLPVIPGHEIVGRIDAVGPGISSLSPGQCVGAGWLGASCGACSYCRAQKENLCDAPVFTGYTDDGGFATHVCLDARFVYPLGVAQDAAALAPLMCAGLIGWRSLRAAGEAKVLGLYGFGASAHILLQVALWQARRCYVFTRPGDNSAQAFARELGAQWAGGSDERPPERLDAAIIFAPDGALVPTALSQLKKGGRLVCAGIHMSDIPGFAYSLLWGERHILSVANLTREDAAEFLKLAGRIGLKTHVTAYPLDRANEALADLRDGRFTGAAVLIPPA